MIWALLAMFFLNGTGTLSGAALTTAQVAALGDRVTVVVDDSDRQKAAIAVIKALQSETKAFEDSFAQSGKRLSKLYAEHADNRQQMNAVLDGLNAEWSERQVRAIDARFALREQLSEREWSTLFESE